MEEQRIILLTDEEEGDIPFEVLDEIEWQNRTYLVLMEAELSEEEAEETEVTILRRELDENGEEAFVWEEDEEAMQYVFDLYQAADEDYEFGDAE